MWIRLLGVLPLSVGVGVLCVMFSYLRDAMEANRSNDWAGEVGTLLVVVPCGLACGLFPIFLAAHVFLHGVTW